jgi:DNA polymerase III subunit epsilon
MDFITLDFEIANNNLNSACSMGMVFVKENQIIDESYYLIQPPTLEFDSKMMSVHGIKPSDVISAPSFEVIWKKIEHHFKQATIIAHNAQFDMSVLHACLNEYSIEMPDFNYICSIPISTRASRGYKLSNSLKDRCQHFGIQLHDHHNSMADARAAAELVIKSIEMKKCKSIQSYINRHSSLPVRKFSELKPQTHFIKRKSFNRVNISEIAATVESYNENHPFYNKNVVFTGTLQNIDRQTAMQHVVNLGGVIKSGVSSKTNYLVVGHQDQSLVGESGLSSKELKAHNLIEKGFTLKILSEQQFLELLGI